MSVDESETPHYIVTAPGDEGEDNNRPDVSVLPSTKSISHSTRSHSLQSSSMSATIMEQSNLSSSLMQQLKAQSSVNIVTEKHMQKFSSSSSSATSAMSASSTISTSKGKFQSFLQHPDPESTLHGSASFLSAQQKHVRQFVRSTSAHSSTDSGSCSGILSTGNRPDKCTRSSSQQIDDCEQQIPLDQTKAYQQSSTILISKSAETIEALKSTTTSHSMRTHLTLFGGFLAPPNRKLTILSPIHAPPGLHELLKKHRSPLSPRISFPGSDSELFP